MTHTPEHIVGAAYIEKGKLNRERAEIFEDLKKLGFFEIVDKLYDAVNDNNLVIQHDTYQILQSGELNKLLLRGKEIEDRLPELKKILEEASAK